MQSNMQSEKALSRKELRRFKSSRQRIRMLGSVRFALVLKDMTLSTTVNGIGVGTAVVTVRRCLRMKH